VNTTATAGAGSLRALQRDGVAIRLFFTVWLVYSLHFASDIVRETYLSLSLGESLSIRVDDYLGLHPDLFEIEGRGVYINNNPGVSMLGAVPYAIARPFIDALLRVKPELAAPRPPTVYDDSRPNRVIFMNQVRARGLDVKLGLAAISIHAGLMVPLGAAAAVAMFVFLRRRLGNERQALLFALLYAFGTPIFFRSAFINQNAVVAHAVLLAFIVAAGIAARPPDTATPSRSLLLVGVLVGFALLCDYSGAPLALVFGLWVIAEGWKRGGFSQSARDTGVFLLGTAPPLLVLFGYQWMAFGNPLLPAQTYMPATEYSVRGWNGFFWPDPGLLWRNLLDPRYGLVAFCPMLIAAFAAPFLKGDRARPSRSELWLIFGAFLGLYLFISSVQFAFLQWNTGVRYIVPAVPLLFIALVPVLLRLPRWALWTLVIPTLAISWSVSMTRAAVPEALARVLLRGFELPFLTVLQKTAAGYAPFLEDGASPLAIFVLCGVVLWLVWRGQSCGHPTDPRLDGR
jgi:hypothetical protein